MYGTVLDWLKSQLSFKNFLNVGDVTLVRTTDTLSKNREVLEGKDPGIA